ncbi:hypothetical protein GXW74_06800 [Roseomonas eburnea]|uniref:Uncharacterized protein n=1 Tax=Neoroseomonas eburnea TaxID=1346889 RepID=A0A9X9X902_9PROT|nr:hypothetical protein [Neoroseomonas eburnea]MBR0680188.1 hypothetical protein [Neoroseomonas eburnea]
MGLFNRGKMIATTGARSDCGGPTRRETVAGAAISSPQYGHDLLKPIA